MANRPSAYRVWDLEAGVIRDGLTIDHNGFRVTGGIFTGLGSSSVNGGTFTDVQHPPTNAKIQVKRGLAANLPTLLVGELGYATDTGGLYIGGVSGNRPAGGAVIRETSGPTDLTWGAVDDGEFVKRVGATLVSATPTGGASIVATGNITGQTATGSLINYATPASDGKYRAGGWILINSEVGSSLTFVVAWTDPGNNPRSVNLVGSGTPDIAGYYLFPASEIWTKASSSVTVDVGGSIITVNYDAGATLEQIA